MKRAVVVFLENKRPLLLQFSWLYTSLKYIKSKDTDLVVFGTDDALEKVPDDCIKIPCPIATEPPEFVKYFRINSNYYYTKPEVSILNQYDYIFKTDADTFLTPAWNSFYPEQYTTGKGGYVNSMEVRQHLKRITELHGLKHQGIHNIGATHYGKPEDVIKVSQTAVEIAKYLLTVEFKDDPGKWPGWYGGVANMYSNEIAVNGHIESFTIDRLNIDFPSTSPETTDRHVHIHCYHTNHIFSKFAMEKGKYNDINPNDLDLNIVRDYCLFIALKAQKEFNI
ncbi:DUF7164 domain-containing protein [Neobacillus cucumis]|uniref:DUF7164 domain-containing protein n=1 Tax=Neobacillus cucumis TaxID=1740721 RepID=A0A2N5HIG4_9BACI|nr:hypothetical protein [Neobacillus cucumis]PLS05311.1 hypothetical protein CVD27_09940 [Neobacillus cucumis]